MTGALVMVEALDMAEALDMDDMEEALDMDDIAIDMEEALWVMYEPAAVVVIVYDGEGEAYVLYMLPLPELRPHCVWHCPRHWASAVSATVDVSVMI